MRERNHAFMKKFPIALLASLILWLTPGASLHAQAPSAPNAYDLLGRVLVPLAGIFSPDAPKRALSATLVLQEMTDLPPELAGARVELLLQPPDRALIRGLYEGKPVTICRAGESVWITPNAPPFDALANPPVDLSQKKRKHSQGEGLGQMVLPFPPQHLALLPILFQVREAGQQKGERVLEVRLMRELARSLGVEDWSARLGVDAQERPASLMVSRPGWKLAVRVERLEYATELPASTWQAPAGALRLNAWQIQQWANVISREVEARRPAAARE